MTTAVAVGGLGTPDMHEIVISPLLGGKLARENEILDGVEWPAEAKRPGSGQTLGQSISVGITNLTTHFDAAYDRLAAGEQFTVVGFSAGSLVVNDFMRELAADPNAPTKDQVKFILVADSSRQKLLNDTSKYNPQYDYTYRPAPQTIYDIDVVTGEYDGAADLPDRWWNFLAVANAIAGGIFVHVPMMFSDYEAVTPEGNITRVTNSLGGTTTTYLVPTAKLPIVQLLPFLAPREAELKAKIDAGYTRNDVKTATASRSFAAPVSVQQTAAVVEDDADVEETTDVADTDAAAGDTAESDASDSTTGGDTGDKEDVVDEDTDLSTADDDEAAAEEEADTTDSDAAETGDEDESDSGATESDSSGDSSSDGSGSSDSGSSE
ncbi:hypothetical protein FHR72_004129 [Mycolicibacterium iranicum]|uniref:PE-PPE domain-containing protein n=1 Tax=Mycolicibacterium iranicum TaxID=912594 RepID=A0A839QDQ6_MYCIR|nr:PE-PPE domain-containing protein [Mycolicibacterium iranicum]MBB2992625.1 hypothetical protein [Mycolicibacterium iranicum]